MGFAPGLQRLVDTHPTVNVTLSVHSPYADERAELIPLQRRFPLSECLDILDTHVTATRRKTYLAYLLIDRLNDSVGHAAELARMISRRSRPELFHVSVIPYNDAVGVNAGVPATTSRPGARVSARTEAERRTRHEASAVRRRPRRGMWPIARQVPDVADVRSSAAVARPASGHTNLEIT